MQKTNTKRIAMFTLFLLGTLAVATIGIQTEAFATHSGVYFEDEGLVESVSQTGEEGVGKYIIPPRPDPIF